MIARCAMTNFDDESVSEFKFPDCIYCYSDNVDFVEIKKAGDDDFVITFKCNDCQKQFEMEGTFDPKNTTCVVLLEDVICRSCQKGAIEVYFIGLVDYVCRMFQCQNCQKRFYNMEFLVTRDWLPSPSVFYN